MISKRGCRDKGRRGQTKARNMLTERDWTVDDLSCGRATADLIATDPHGTTWCVEAKDQATLNVAAFTRQAKQQADERGLPWLLIAHIYGTRRWLVVGQDREPEVWEERERCEEVEE